MWRVNAHSYRPQSTFSSSCTSFFSFSNNHETNIFFQAASNLQHRYNNSTEATSNEKSINYSKTLFLPKTTFSLRANAAVREPTLRERCTKFLYEWQSKRSTTKEWITHDGPPYANGNPHMGHALNKILKDIINRYKVLSGHKVSYVPGWDCHGLPIEMKALQESGKTQWENANQIESQIVIRKKAKECAERAIEEQKKHYVEWGVMGDWENPYRTMDPAYETEQLQVFYDLYKQGIIYQGKKPVHWSPSSKTALAEAELEYPTTYSSLSVFFKFPLLQITNKTLKEKLMNNINNLSPNHHHPPRFYLISWTTTPWTLPANMGMCVNPEMEYCLVECHYNTKSEKAEKEFFIVAKSRIGHVSAMLKAEFVILSEFKGSLLVGNTYDGLLREGSIYDASFVTEDTGTGIVHAAPGHGLEDFMLLTKVHGISPFCPVDDDGKYTTELDHRFHGKFVLTEGNALVLNLLKDHNMFLHSHHYSHKYPHDWRTKKPIIMRATTQWFADVTKIVPSAVKQIQDHVEMIPSIGKNRLEAVLKQRDDWCISRQRAWGFPIPVFFDAQNKPHVTQDAIDHLKSMVSKYGTDCWWTHSTEELLPPSMRNDGNEYRRCMDTIDVWFDSGVSWASVIRQRNIRYPVDLYLEGSDQHRGWFQSSLLTSVGVTGKAPYQRIITHGFVVDGEGRKMSKSIGNVIDPAEIVRGGVDKKKQPAYGSDLLRSWAASSDYTKDVNISAVYISTVFEAQQKFRNTIRFLLGNLFDFESPLPYSELSEIDRYMLHTLYSHCHDITSNYESFQFKKVFSSLITICASDLSSFYFEAIKDRVYSDGKTSTSRRSAQTILFHYLIHLTKSIAPLTPHLAEDIFENTPSHLRSYFLSPSQLQGNSNNNNGDEIKSVFQTGWYVDDLPSDWQNGNLESKWSCIRHMKNNVNKHLEDLREKNQIKASTEASVTIGLSSTSQEYRWLSELSASDLALSFGVSVVSLCETDIPFITAQKVTEFSKCTRCWMFTAPLRPESETSESETACLCSRCVEVIASGSYNTEI